MPFRHVLSGRAGKTDIARTASDAPGTDMEQDVGGLQGISDPDLMTRYTAVRTRLALTPVGKPGHGEVKRSYDALLAEYRRRMDEARRCVDGLRV
jgi:hypothetical protein